MIGKIKSKWKMIFTISRIVCGFIFLIGLSVLISSWLGCDENCIKQPEQYKAFCPIVCDLLEVSLILSGATLGALLGFKIQSDEKQNNKNSTQSKQ